ncbi:MAG: small multi-drug export protein, partial [Desulfamplus sp.]|nr:small multi-drug export protein [Desulfamplus sp.]
MGPLKTDSKQLKLYKTAEGKILWTGIVLTLIIVLLIGYYVLENPVKAKNLIFVFVAHLLGGRAAAVGLCIMNEMKFFPILIYNFFLELQIVCISYSLFVLSVTNHIKAQWIHRIATHLMHNADKHKDKIEKYEWIGLFLFVMAPLP